jgi:phospholipid transport system substrate-binding protein
MRPATGTLNHAFPRQKRMIRQSDASMSNAPALKGFVIRPLDRLLTGSVAICAWLVFVPATAFADIGSLIAFTLVIALPTKFAFLAAAPKRNRLMPVSSLRRRTLLPLALCSVAVWVALGRADAATDVAGPVEELHAGLMAIMKTGKTAPFRQRYDMIAPVIGRTFDLDTILRQAIGPRWSALPVDQQAALEVAFQRYTIASYVANFETYAGERFEIAPDIRAVGRDRIVETRIVATSGQAHALDYVMRQEGIGWKVVDVLAEGAISRVAAQRSEMRSVLSDTGGAGLLVNLRQKTAQLSGGILQ